MPPKRSHRPTFYNDIALRLAHKLFGIEHLHYGYFDGIEPTLENFPKAQELYVQKMLSHIPEGVKTVFDVGCGTGGVAKALLAKGFQVTCLAPDPYLTEKAAKRTEDKATVITDFYENIGTEIDETGVDLILFSESCQYVKINDGWRQNHRYLKPGGYVLISDFFRIREIDRPNISRSGHVLEKFLNAADRHGFDLIEQVDITPYTAPTMDVYQKTLHDKVFPVFGNGSHRHLMLSTPIRERISLPTTKGITICFSGNADRQRFGKSALARSGVTCSRL